MLITREKPVNQDQSWYLTLHFYEFRLQNPFFVSVSLSYTIWDTSVGHWLLIIGY